MRHHLRTTCVGIIAIKAQFDLKKGQLVHGRCCGYQELNKVVLHADTVATLSFLRYLTHDPRRAS